VKTRELKKELCVPSHDIGPSVTVVRTCRQIYHEAVGVLYSGNAFWISVELHCHNAGMFQLRLAAPFLSEVPSQVSVLRYVAIDVDPVCPDACDRYWHEEEDRLDMLPLVRVLWARHSIKRRISFTHTGRIFDPRVHGSCGYVDKPPIPDHGLRLLEQFTKAASQDDALNFQKYEKFERLVDYILVDSSLNNVNVTFPSTSHCGNYD
jgi:hypothetical protein